MPMFTVKAEVVRTSTLLIHFEAPNMEAAERMMEELPDCGDETMFEELGTGDTVDETYYELTIESDVAKADKNVGPKDIQGDVKSFCESWIEDNREDD